MKNRMRRLGGAGLLLALTACAGGDWTPGSAGSADTVIAVRAYDGPALEGWNVAAVYGFDGRDGGDAQWICGVDGRDLSRSVVLDVRCPNVVFLLPGPHELEWRYHSANYDAGFRRSGNIVGHGKLHVQVEAGRTYRLLASGAYKTVLLLPQAGRPDLLLYSSINPHFDRRAIDYAAALPLEPAKK